MDQEQPAASQKRPRDPELVAMEKIQRAVEDLTPLAQTRVLDWAYAKFYGPSAEAVTYTIADSSRAASMRALEEHIG